MSHINIITCALSATALSLTTPAGAQGVDNPLPLEASVTRKLTLEQKGAAYFSATLPAGDFKVVVDTRLADQTTPFCGLQSDLSMTDSDGVITQENVIMFKEFGDVAWRKTYNFSLKKPMKLGFKLRNDCNTVEFWLTILKMEARSGDMADDKPQVVTLKEDDLKSFDPKKADIIPFPFFGKTMPILMLPDQRKTGLLGRGESAYYIIALPEGKYKTILDFADSQGDKTFILG